MMGINASYPISQRFTGTLFLINGYWHLADANHVPSWGGQLAYKPTPQVTLKETILVGPQQTDTSPAFWRFLTDSMVERKTNRLTTAVEYIYSTENVAGPERSRASMMSAQAVLHWAFNQRWSATVRPELFWDPEGRWTLASQTVKAVTTTLEYRVPYRQLDTIIRVEHRYDDSRGPQGGFFRGAETAPGLLPLTPGQHLLILGVIIVFEH